jgi:Bucentaur or craniofacial development
MALAMALLPVPVPVPVLITPNRNMKPNCSLEKRFKSLYTSTVYFQPGAKSTSIAIATAAAAKKPSVGGLDSVLQQIAGPSKISTVAKTSADWDSFKTETGLA